jgi:hypothetical protein
MFENSQTFTLDDMLHTTSQNIDACMHGVRRRHISRAFRVILPGNTRYIVASYYISVRARVHDILRYSGHRHVCYVLCCSVRVVHPESSSFDHVNCISGAGRAQ